MLTDPEEDYERGFVPFLDCTIYLDSRPLVPPLAGLRQRPIPLRGTGINAKQFALIPRTETEYWAEKAISEIRDKIGEIRVLDLFAGSGAIGVAVLKHVPGSSVDFGEIDAAHLPTIEKNIRENGMSPERTRVIQTDVWSNINDTYDFVLANPPYISREKSARVQDSVLLHEPGKALFADDGGFALIEKTIAGLEARLKPGGTLYIEHEPEQVGRIALSAEKAGFSAKTFPDQYGTPRYSVLKLEALR